MAPALARSFLQGRGAAMDALDAPTVKKANALASIITAKAKEFELSYPLSNGAVGHAMYNLLFESCLL